MTGLTGLPLLGTGQAVRGGTLADADYEDSMPTHVIWGEVESITHTHDSTELSGSRTGSDTGTGTGKEKKKLRNKPLSREDITFRSPSDVYTSDGSASSARKPAERVPEAEMLRMVTAGQPQRGDCHAQEDSDSEDDPTPKQPQQVIRAKISKEELEAVMAQIRLNPDGKPTSMGSAGHPENCKPCLFVFTKVGCQNGVICTFCHFKHKRGNRPRPCKGKRNRYRKLMERMEHLADEEADALEVENQENSQQKKNLMTL